MATCGHRQKHPRSEPPFSSSKRLRVPGSNRVVAVKSSRIEEDEEEEEEDFSIDIEGIPEDE